MAENSNIEWCDHTANFWSGCTKVSPACAHCYAETLAKRNSKTFGKWGRGAPRLPHLESARKACLKWSAAQFQRRLKDPSAPRPRVFVNSLSDWLDDEAHPEWLAFLLETIRLCPNLDFLLLTKRPENFRKLLERAQNPFGGKRVGEAPDFVKWVLAWLDGAPPDNAWVGVTVEDQQHAEQRIPHLLLIPARVRFLSCEPLLGLVDLDVPQCEHHGRDEIATASDGSKFCQLCADDGGLGELCCGYFEDGIHWVICGGESGSKARPMHPDWARSLRDQCKDAGIPFFFKQWGEFAPCDPPVVTNIHGQLQATGTWRANDRYVECRETNQWVKRVGKKSAGRLLDGELHDSFPDPQAAIQPA